MTGVWFSVLNIIEKSLFPILMLKGDWDTTKTDWGINKAKDKSL